MATLSTGISWRDLHKIVTAFKTPPPLQTMPSCYLTRLESVTTSAVKVSMLEAAPEPSPEPNVSTLQSASKALEKAEGFILTKASVFLYLPLQRKFTKRF